jgi:ubiquitin C-terminal hydrolase
LMGCAAAYAGYKVFSIIKSKPSYLPKGLVNEGQNCAFNALFHFITSNSLINKQLEKYSSSDDIKRDILEEFQNSSDNYEWERVELMRGLRGAPYDSSVQNYVKKYFVLSALQSMKKAYETEKECGSQILRQALHRVNDCISEDVNQQQDVSECFSALFSEFLPSQKIECIIKRRYDFSKLSSEERPCSDTREKREVRSCISLALGGQRPFSLKTMLKEELCRKESEVFLIEQGKKCENIETITEFEQAPPALYLEIKRYKYAFNSDTREHRIEKQSDPVESPSELEISVAGVQYKYELAGFLYHEGKNPSKGHYLCGKVIDGKKYLFDDERVSLLNSEWDGYLNKAYLLCYIPKKSA